MLATAARYMRERFRQRSERIPLGFSWTFVVTVDTMMVGVGLIATLQRPVADLPVALGAVAVALTPLVLFLVTGIKMEPLLLFVAWTAATAMLLFATSTPVKADFAPLLAVLMVGVVVALSTTLGGVLAAAMAAGLLLAAAGLHRLDAVALYLSFIGMGWLVGFLMRTQQQLMVRQRQTQAALAQHAASDERRRIAREVHDVIAHSLSVTLLHLTAARRGLQQDRDIDDAVDALQQAERLGREAMTDIRRTVGLLDDAPMKRAPEPGVGDIPTLVDDFVHAGLKVTLQAGGPTDRVSAAVGLALYRIAQESLANVAKHAPDSQSTVVLEISRTCASLNISNELPEAVAAVEAASSEGRGLRGMRQRAELLGGTLEAGPAEHTWRVRAVIPLGDPATGRLVFGCAS